MITIFSISLFVGRPNLPVRLDIKDVKFVGERIGEGAFGFVEVVEVNGKFRAGKQYHRNESTFSLKKFLKEFQMMQTLKHDHIVEYYGYHTYDEHKPMVLIMECLETNLHNFLIDDSHKDLPLARKVDLLCGIAQGLKYLHDMCIIHRDLTAANVLLDSKATPKISDFGNSCVIGRNLGSDLYTQSLTRCPGNLDYMAPEAQSTTNYGTEIDMFSFGHLSLFIGIQIPPHPILPPNDPEGDGDLVRGRNEVQRRQKYFTHLYENLGENHSLVILIKNCLSNSPKKRPKVHEVIPKLNAISNDLPLTPPLILNPITQDPESKSVATGTLIVFAVEAIGDNFQFQWQKDGKDIDKNTSRLQSTQTNKTSTLHILRVEKNDEGHYRCLVKNSVKKYSHAAELTVCEYSPVCIIPYC